VSSLDEDRILRGFIGVIDATLRTSYYIQGGAQDGGPADYVSFKFDSAKVPDLPKPRPYREIFVYGPRVEGVHLRFGPVARGGLRWSDRREDFRTEVLGLVKAQMVKNTVIVPVGAKGGFFASSRRMPRRRPRCVAGRGRRLLQAFINGLLDITDNLVDGKVVPPPAWCATTATIPTWWSPPTRAPRRSPTSPTASPRRTASGWATRSPPAVRSATTTRAWASPPAAPGNRSSATSARWAATARPGLHLRRHRRHVRRRVRQRHAAVAHIRLVAAFDHRHIFLDPNPDAAKSFAERERLFKLPRSSWDDYDKALISKGGGVFPRSAKSIPLSPAGARPRSASSPTRRR
jgi:glutamate dehydrogenase